ncbi:MAG: BACON domain-containing protein [Prevotella sp.]|nr:BACON domain-containing protein [Prevotella sp.]
MNRILKILMVVLLMTMTPVGMLAQSASESYDNGLALMKKQDYNGAIASFRRSMTMNKSAANVKNCKAQISKCQRLMKNKGKAATTAAPSKTLSIPNPILNVEANPVKEYGVQIDVTPESNDWMANVEGNVNWIALARSMDGKYLVVKAEPTNQTTQRHASIAVTYDKMTRTIHVTQAGKAVELTASELFIKFRKKGGQMLINVICNSDTVYTNNYNWYIEKAPDWCNAERTSTDLVLKVDPIDKKSVYYKGGRTGDIILRSQNQECVIRVDQK